MRILDRRGFIAGGPRVERDISDLGEFKRAELNLVFLDQVRQQWELAIDQVDQPFRVPVGAGRIRHGGICCAVAVDRDNRRSCPK